MRAKLMLVVPVLFLVAFAARADAAALYVQDFDPWGSTANQDDMNALGISFVQTDYASADFSDLCGYDFVLLCASDGDDVGYLNYALPALGDLENYVECGGLLLIHYALWNYQPGVIAPGGVETVENLTQNLDIDPGHTGDPLVAGVTNADLDGWNYSAHNWFFGRPFDAVINYEDGSGPAYVRYGMGAGQVWLTGMTLEWPYADPQVLYNELSMAQQLGHPCVPEPTALMSLFAGLSLLGGWRLRRK